MPPFVAGGVPGIFRRKPDAPMQSRKSLTIASSRSRSHANQTFGGHVPLIFKEVFKRQVQYLWLSAPEWRVGRTREYPLFRAMTRAQSDFGRAWQPCIRRWSQNSRYGWLPIP
jgi:hypothetical protein